MSRGGFGGRPNMGGNMGGTKLPFDVDPDLEKEVLEYDANGANGEEKDAKTAFVWPEFPGGVPRAPPVTLREKRLIAIERDIIAKRHAGPFYTGPPGSLKTLCNKRTAADFNAFEDQPTYGKKYQKPEFKLPDLKKHKFAAPHLFPKELWSTIGYNPDDADDPDAYAKKKLVLTKKTVIDKLARFDEDADEGVADGGADDEDGEGKEDGEEGEDDGLKDDEFDEDDDDDANDYNGEQYFDDGEEDREETGGDEFAGDDGDVEDCDTADDHKKRMHDQAHQQRMQRIQWDPFYHVPGRIEVSGSKAGRSTRLVQGWNRGNTKEL